MALQYRVTDADERPLTGYDQERMDRFVAKYVAHWRRRHNGHDPDGDHRFPTHWNCTFIVEFDDPERVGPRFQAANSPEFDAWVASFQRPRP